MVDFLGGLGSMEYLFIFDHNVDYLQNGLSAVPEPPDSADNREFTVWDWLLP